MAIKAKRLIIALVAFYLVIGVCISGYYWLNNEKYVQTNDARTKVNISLLKAPSAGHVMNFDIRENQEVTANEVLGFVQSGAASTASGNRLPLVSPVSGQILRIGITDGEMVTSGQNLLAIADTKTTYVEARLTETEAARVHVGQLADVSLDTSGGQTFAGVVSKMEDVTEKAVWPIVSLTTPRQQPKEEELVAVKIEVQGAHLIPGTNASVKIRVGDGADGFF
jgi:multidrug resistance efflux pump